MRKIFVIVLVLVMVVAMAVSVTSATAAPPMTQSSSVAVIGSLTVWNGGYFPALSGFTFTTLSPANVNSANLANYDTVFLNVSSSGMNCNMNNLSAQAKADLIAFVGTGKKLIISDSECSSQDYSWLPYPFTTNNPGAYGATGTLTIVENSTLASSNASDASYIDAALLNSGTDAIGDMNVMTTLDSAWCVAMSGTNHNQVTGPVQCYARYGTAGSVGLIIYNGFDWDYSTSTTTPDTSTARGNLVKVWQQMLLQPVNPDGLPCGVAVVGITLTPRTATNPVGTAHTVTASLVDLLGQPQAGILVSFQVVSGPNAGQQTSTPIATDAAGNASWTYASNGNVGQDVIKASFPDQAGAPVYSNNVTKDWEPLPQGPCTTQTWKLDANTPIVGTNVFEMDRYYAGGDLLQGSADGNNNSVPVPANNGQVNGTATWIADEAAKVDVTFPDGDWITKLCIQGVDMDQDSDIDQDDADALSALISVRVGSWNGSFNTFGLSSQGVMRWVTGTDIFRMEVQTQTGSEEVLTGDYLALEVSNSDQVKSYYVLTEGCSELQSPCSDPGYPTPEIATAILVGLGVLGLAGYVFIRRRSAGMAA
ncbi:MAG: hypothetical protein PHV74_03165 [Dehalococcoidia bacterium]|nr:hypothetical protein [Dehalococcoidia bacterium]